MAKLPFDIQIRCAKTLKEKYPFSMRHLRMTAGKILEELGWKKAALSLWLVGDRQIRRLNQQHLKHDRSADVIAFSQLEGKKLKAPAAGAVFLGDIVISLDTTARQAPEYGNPFFYELAFYLCHGILHLMGHSDQTKKQALRMERRQKAVLEKIGFGKIKLNSARKSQ